MEALLKELEIVARPSVRTRIDPPQEFAPVMVNSAWCKACDLCSALCPKSVLEPGHNGKPVVAHPGECTHCGICWTHCPDMAITSKFH